MVVLAVVGRATGTCSASRRGAVARRDGRPRAAASPRRGDLAVLAAGLLRAWPAQRDGAASRGFRPCHWTKRNPWIDVQCSFQAVAVVHAVRRSQACVPAGAGAAGAAVSWVHVVCRVSCSPGCVCAVTEPVEGFLRVGWGWRRGQVVCRD